MEMQVARDADLLEALRSEVESAFGVEIHGRADEYSTAGALHHGLLAALRDPQPRRQSTAAALFAVLRDALADSCGVAKEEISLDTKLGSLLPLVGRRSRWEALQRRLGWRFPALRDPPGLVIVFAAFWLVVYFTGFIWLAHTWLPSADEAAPDTADRVSNTVAVLCVLGLNGGAILFAFAARPILRRLSVRLPDGCFTVGALTRAIQFLNCASVRERLTERRPTPVREGPAASCNSVCLNPRVFFRLRRAIAETVGLSARSILLDTRLVDIFPLRHRRAKWRTVGTRLGWSIPALQRSRRTVLAAVLAGLLLSVAVGWLLYLSWYEAIHIYGLVFAGIYYAMAYWLTLPLAQQFTSGCETVRDLVHLMLVHNYEDIVRPGEVPAAEELWLVLRTFLAQMFAIEEHQIRPSSRFVEDLGLGEAE